MGQDVVPAQEFVISLAFPCFFQPLLGETNVTVFWVSAVWWGLWGFAKAGPGCGIWQGQGLAGSALGLAAELL